MKHLKNITSLPSAKKLIPKTHKIKTLLQQSAKINLTKMRRKVLNFQCELFFLIVFVLFFLIKEDLVNAQWTDSNQARRQSFYPPVLKVRSFEGFLAESAQAGTRVRVSRSQNSDTLQILVNDKDLAPGMPPAIYQYIITGYGAEKFAVDERGNLYLNSGNFDADRSSSAYLLYVMAREIETEPIRSSTPISITVNVIDENDNAPMFPQTLYFANVSAYAFNGERTVLKIKAISEDTDKFGKILTYRIVKVSNGAIRSFRYNTQTNELRAIDSLMAGHDYKVVLEAENDSGFVGRTTIIVHAVEPTMVFPQSNTQHPPSQNILPPVAPLISMANWPTSSSAQNYLTELLTVAQNSNLGGSTSFYTNPPNLQLTLMPMLNQQIEVYTPPTNIQAAPPQSFPTIYNRRIAAINNNAESERSLKHQTIVTELNETTPQNSIVAVLGDEETRGFIYFRIVSGNEDAKFAINSDSGTISTAQLIDRETIDSYILRIEARLRQPDQPLYLTTLIVNITDSNDNAPEFHSASPKFFNLKVDEKTHAVPLNLPIGKIIVSDADKDNNGKVLLRILPPMNRLFTVNDEGEFLINGDFLPTHFGERRITILASDHGDPPLETRAHIVVNIQGSSTHQTNAEAPLFALSPLNSINNAQVDSSASILSESSSHENTKIYETTAAPVSALFNIATLPDSLLNTEVPLFAMVNPPISTTVTSFNYMMTNLESNNANDQKSFNRLASGFESDNKPVIEGVGTTLVTPEITQLTTKLYFAPVFTVPILNLEVLENEDDLELCTVEAKFLEDLPAGWSRTVTYVMETGDESLFALDSQTGKLTLIKGLDAEKHKSYKLQIGTVQATQESLFVTNNALAHSATIIIHVVDVNDYIPNFEQDVYIFRLFEHTEPGTVIGQVTAYDQDADTPNNKVTYRLMSKGGVENYFYIDSETGLIKLTRELREYGGQNFTLKIEAADGGETLQSAKTNVIVEVQRPTKLNVNSNLGLTNNKIKTENENEIENKSNKNKFLLKTTSGNHNNKVTSTPVIHFLAQNYSAKIMEGVRAPALVARLPIKFNVPDIDTRFLLCALESGNIHGTFRVTPSNKMNACELRSEIQLDREKVEQYLLNISLTLGSITDFALVAVHVVDANDNAPKFAFPKITPESKDNDQLFDGYFAVVSSLAPPNTHVITVKAVDFDFGFNGLVTYMFENATIGDSIYFTIGHETGKIMTQKRMPEVASAVNSGKNAKTLFDFRIKACDNPSDNSRPLCSKAQVLVNLIGNQHRFITVLRGETSKNVKKYEQDLTKVMRPFTEPCTLLRIEKIEDFVSDQKADNKFVSAHSKDIQPSNEPAVLVYWYSLNLSNKRICRKQEFRKLFSAMAHERITSNLQKLSPIILDEIKDEVYNTPDADSNGDSFTNHVFALFDWHTISGVLMLCFIGVGILASITLCFICIFRFKRLKSSKRRSVTRCTYPGGIYPVLKYGLNNNPVVYLPTVNSANYGAPTAGVGFGSLERDKFYETQMLELPINDEDYNFLHGVKNMGCSSSNGSPSSIWSKSVVNGVPASHYNHHHGHHNFLYHHNNNSASNSHFLPIGEDCRTGGRFNNYSHHGQQFIYGTTTTTSSNGAGGNGSGIPTSNGMISGRRAAGKSAASQHNGSAHFRPDIHINAFREEDSSREFFIEEDEILSHLNNDNNVNNNVNKLIQHNSKYVF